MKGKSKTKQKDLRSEAKAKKAQQATQYAKM